MKLLVTLTITSYIGCLVLASATIRQVKRDTLFMTTNQAAGSLNDAKLETVNSPVRLHKRAPMFSNESSSSKGKGRKHLEGSTSKKIPADYKLSIPELKAKITQQSKEIEAAESRLSELYDEEKKIQKGSQIQYLFNLNKLKEVKQAIVNQKVVYERIARQRLSNVDKVRALKEDSSLAAQQKSDIYYEKAEKGFKSEYNAAKGDYWGRIRDQKDREREEKIRDQDRRDDELRQRLAAERSRVSHTPTNPPASSGSRTYEYYMNQLLGP